ncbi:MAG: ketoacyl-ACP synthase III [Ignavibacterium sp.]
MAVGIKYIEYYLPQKFLLNNDFSELGVNPDFMENKIGIEKRYISEANESVGDMAIKALSALKSRKLIDYSKVPLLIFCTQNPDYQLPTTACLIQDQIKMPKYAMCFDINLGCSAYPYALSIAKSIMHESQYENAIIITSEAYSKVISYKDKTVATIFSDAAAVTYLQKDYENCVIDRFSFGTDGSGANNLIVPVSGSKIKRNKETAKIKEYSYGVSRSDENLYMNGQEISKFVLTDVKKSIIEFLTNQNLEIGEIDRYIFHQANKYILEALAMRLNIPANKNYIDLSIGNTVSSTLPIGIKKLYYEKKQKDDKIILLSGFGVGYSWANMTLKINNQFGENL